MPTKKSVKPKPRKKPCRIRIMMPCDTCSPADKAHLRSFNDADVFLTITAESITIRKERSVQEPQGKFNFTPGTGSAKKK